jgi:hypothetical protein
MRTAVQFLLVTLASLLVASQSFAAPVVYGFESGFVNVQAVRVDDQSLVWDETLALDSPGGSSFVEFDSAGTPTQFGTATIDDFLFSVPTQGPFSLLQPYGVHDMFTIESVLLTPGIGFVTTVGFSIGPDTWSITATPVDIEAYYSATDSTLQAPPVNNIGAPLSGGNIVGTLQLVNGQLELHLNNVIMSTLDGTAFGEPDLQITGDFTWFGSVAAAVPEPSTGLLMGLGLIGLAVRSRQERRS